MEPRELSSIPHFRPGGDGLESTEQTEVLRLGMNENPLGPSPKAIEAVRHKADSMHQYPAGPHAALDAALSKRWDVSVDQIWLGAGAVGVIDTLTRAMVEQGEAILRPDPGFSYFGRSNRSHYGTDQTYPLLKADDFALDVDRLMDIYDGQPLLYLNTPHNPTGATMEPETVMEVVDRIDEQTLLVVDEAYEPFSTEPSMIDLVEETDQIAILRTFSKTYGLAGARIGYGIMPPSIADAYGQVSTPFGISQLSLVAALGALEDEAFLERSVSIARKGRTYLREELNCRTWPSEGNFVLAEVGDASGVASELEDRGLKVRDCTSFGLDDCIRITVGTPDQNRRVVTLVNRVVA